MKRVGLILPVCLALLFSAGAAGVNCVDSREAREGDARQGRDRSEDEYKRARRRLVDEIRARGVGSGTVMKAMEKVPRHLFVPEELRHLAYANHPLPIGLDQTISQPEIVAYMTEAAQVSKKKKVLEIGTGSGYQAAVLGEVAGEVYSIEIIPELAERARRVLDELGYRNVFVRTGNGYLGWPEQAPFDAIVVTAAPDEIPQALVEQLAVGGRMIVPVGVGNQEMTIVERKRNGVTTRKTIPVRFVPMTGKPAQ
jgi:protein-L-isoaspartate(D-aspartate) O-methyltransferase